MLMKFIYSGGPDEVWVNLMSLAALRKSTNHAQSCDGRQWYVHLDGGQSFFVDVPESEEETLLTNYKRCVQLKAALE